MSKEIQVKIKDEKAMLFTPYNMDFVKRIKQFSDARWDTRKKCWTINKENLDAARTVMREIYGYSDVDINEKVTVRIHVKEYMCEEQTDVMLFGKVLSHAYGRDSGGKPGRDVVYVHGNPCSGGSAAHWESGVEEGSEILLHNVNKNLYEAALEHPTEEYEINLVEDDIDFWALKEEKRRLLKRIEDIDLILQKEEQE